MKQYSYEDIPKVWEKVKHLYPQAIVQVQNRYAKKVVTLDADLTKELDDFEKIILADRGNGSLGGEVNGNIVTVYTD